MARLLGLSILGRPVAWLRLGWSKLKENWSIFWPGCRPKSSGGTALIGLTKEKKRFTRSDCRVNVYGSFGKCF
ncbi:hypothetical protein COP1_010193 [Malus domestica]